MRTTRNKTTKRETISTSDTGEAGDRSASNIQMIALSQIERDGKNHRLATENATERLQGLANSLVSDGQQQPVQVFAYPEGQSPSGKPYLLVFGFRRCAAAELAGWTTIAAVIKPMPLKSHGSVDRLAIERARGVENLQRENLNPIEECLVIQQLLENLPSQIKDQDARDGDGRPTDAAVQYLAGLIGRTEAWVRDRLYLERLSPTVKQMILDGKLFLIYAREIAKLADHAEQERVAGMCECSPKDGHCHTTIQQVRRYVADRQNSLRGVPWQLDKEFPKHKQILGACANCPFNSSNDKKLFEHDGQAVPEGFCLRSSCFEAKRAVTDKAVEKAVLKIISLKKAPTESSAAEVAEAFVKPGRVARQAKKRTDDAPQTPKPRKLEYWETPQYKAQQAFYTAQREWNEKMSEAITATLKDHPGRLTALMLLAATGVLRVDATAKTLAKLDGLLKLTLTPKLEDLQKLEKKLLSQRGFRLEDVINLYNRHEMAQHIAKLYGIDLPAQPKLEDFLPAKQDS